MSFKIKVDEDLPAAITRMLKAGDYDAVSVLEQNMGGLKDPPLWQAVQAEGRFLITADKARLSQTKKRLRTVSLRND